MAKPPHLASFSTTSSMSAVLLLLATLFQVAHSFHIGRGNAHFGAIRSTGRSSPLSLSAEKDGSVSNRPSKAGARSATYRLSSFKDSSSDDDDADNDEGGVEEYRNAPTAVLSNFMKMDDAAAAGKANPIDSIDFDAPKFDKGVDLTTLAAILDAELYDKEWFVTGKINPIYFSDEFEFVDPDVKVKGIEEYARGVYKLFDQETSRAEIISTVVNDTKPDTITCTWRLSGKVNIGPGLTIKPYICYTDFTVESGLITFQEDRFDIPQWDILLSALFPFLVGRVTAEPAPPVEPRVVQMPTIGASSVEKDAEGSPFDKLLQIFGN